MKLFIELERPEKDFPETFEPGPEGIRTDADQIERKKRRASFGGSEDFRFSGFAHDG